MDTGAKASTDPWMSTFARESGFDSVKDLLGTAKHGKGHTVYLIRFHYLQPGAWDTPRTQP